MCPRETCCTKSQIASEAGFVRANIKGGYFNISGIAKIIQYRATLNNLGLHATPNFKVYVCAPCI